MKKRLIQIALILGLLALMCAAAQATGAEEPEPAYGFCKVEEENADVALTPVGVQKTSDNRYPGATKMTVAYNKAQSGSEYLLCVLAQGEDGKTAPDADHMAYIDQKPAEGTSVEFTAFPKAVDAKTTSVKYEVWLSSNADASAEDAGLTGFTKVGAFEYYAAGMSAVMLGDVDGDEDITVNDALDALFLSVGTVNNPNRPEEEQREAADVDQQNGVEVIDALNILYCSVGTKTGVKALDDFLDSK